MRGHPAFVAQHATATCCRGCLARWHGIPTGRELTSAEREHVLAAIEHWLRAQMGEPSAASAPATDAGTPQAPRRRATRQVRAGSDTGQGDLFAAPGRPGR